MEQETTLVDELNKIQNNETALKKHFKITRQQMRRENIRLRKQERADAKTVMMKKRIPGGSAIIREWRET